MEGSGDLARDSNGAPFQDGPFLPPPVSSEALSQGCHPQWHSLYTARMHLAQPVLLTYPVCPGVGLFQPEDGVSASLHRDAIYQGSPLWY